MGHGIELKNQTGRFSVAGLGEKAKTQLAAMGNLATKLLPHSDGARRTSRRRTNRFESHSYQSLAASAAPVEQIMGEAAEARPMRAAAARRHLHLGVDVPLLVVIFTLVVFGLLMVYSASWQASYYNFNGDSAAIFKRQVLWLLVGSGLAGFLAWFDYHKLNKFIVIAMVGTVVGLVGVLFVNDERHGAVRTILSGSIQPSELAKLVIVIYLAVWLYAKRDRLHDISFGLLPLAAILGVVGGLILLQPDLSATATIVLLGVLLFFLSGGDLKQMAILLIGALVVGGLVVYLTPTGHSRMSTYIPGLIDPTKASDQLKHAIEAFVRGGLTGVGIGKGVTKLIGLPVPNRDSIFAVVGEETGLLGAGLMVFLYGMLLWRGLRIAHRAPDGLGALLAAGLSIWLAAEAFINMAVMVGLLPIAGNALPFISAGGSNLVVSLAAVGIIINVSRMSEKGEENQERSFSAVVDLRRRNWRRSEPSPRRPSNPER